MGPQTVLFFTYIFHLTFTAVPQGDLITTVGQIRKLRPGEVECLTTSLSRAGMRLHVSLTPKPRS